MERQFHYQCLECFVDYNDLHVFRQAGANEMQYRLFSLGLGELLC